MALASQDYKARRRAHAPPRPPGLNPVEKFWGWLRKRLRAMDLADLKAKRRPLQKTALKARVRRLVQSARAKAVAKNFVLGLHKARRAGQELQAGV